MGGGWGGEHKRRLAGGVTAPVWGHYSTDVLVSQVQNGKLGDWIANPAKEVKNAKG